VFDGVNTDRSFCDQLSGERNSLGTLRIGKEKTKQQCSHYYILETHDRLQRTYFNKHQLAGNNLTIERSIYSLDYSFAHLLARRLKSNSFKVKRQGHHILAVEMLTHSTYKITDEVLGNTIRIT